MGTAASKHMTGTSQCRLEANYAHQQELDMIPLMMQENYKPQGWRMSQRKPSIRFYQP